MSSVPNSFIAVLSTLVGIVSNQECYLYRPIDQYEVYLSGKLLGNHKMNSDITDDIMTQFLYLDDTLCLYDQQS